MHRSLQIALLDLKRVLASPGELAFGLALPILLFALMYGAFGGEAGFHATAHIVDLDGGAGARELLDRVEALDEISVRERSAEEVDRALERAAILTAFVIPAGFSAALERGGPTSLVVKRRGAGGQTGQIVSSLVAGVAQGIGEEARIRRIVARALAGSGVSADRIAAEVQRQLDRTAQSPPVAVRVRRLEEGGADAVDRLVPGMLVLFLMFSVTMGAQTLVEERRIGTLERLMTTRLSVDELFVGKFLAGVTRASTQAAVLLALAFAGLRIGGATELVRVMAFSVLVASAVSAVGLVIGSAARTRDQATWAALVFTVVMMVFGGTFFEVGPGGPLDIISRATVNRYAIDAMQAMLARGQTLAQQGAGIGVMLGVTVVGLAVARILFRAAQGRR